MTNEQLSILIVSALCPMSAVVFGWLIIRIRQRGGRVKSGEYGIADLFMAFFIALFFGANVVLAHSTPDGTGVARALSAKDISANVFASIMILSIVVGFLAVRRLSPIKLFGLREMPIWRALLSAPGLVVAAYPALLIVTLLAQWLMGGQAHEQDVVTFFKEAAHGNQTSHVVALFFMAVVIAPIMEETVFRGYLYGVFKGWAGAIPSAIFTATLFAAVHNSVSVFPSLLVLAVALTVAYEWSGSLLLPIAMHATFNATQLGTLLMAISQKQP